MKIALLGYGRMGKIIQEIAISRGHTTPLVIDIDNQDEFTIQNLKKVDVAIDFSVPTSAYSNIMKCFEADVPVVSGTTGWHDKFDEVKKMCDAEGKACFWASNFSIGVNVFFELNKQLAKMMNKFSDYNVTMEEVHHIHKLDAPSGTAITLAEGVIENLDRKEKWVLDGDTEDPNLNIHAIREGEVPGIHSINYDSDVDYIYIKHSANSRKGFALGAVVAAEYMKGKKGLHTMNDMLDL